MQAIHLIQKDPKLTPWPQQPGSKVYESGFWDLSIDTASMLVGKEIYFHLQKTDGAYFGGTITGVRTKDDDPGQGRIIFTFMALASFKNKKTSKSEWKKDMKFVE